MIFKAIFILILSNIASIDGGISYCCPGNNILGSNKNCSDGSPKKILDCEESYIMRTSDQNTKISHDDKNNLVLDDKDKIPPNQYCRTTLQSKNVEVYIVCAAEEEAEAVITNVSRTVCTIFMLISVCFIILTIITYLLILKSLHLQDFCILYSITALGIAYVTLSIINLSGYIPIGACHFLAYLLYFSFMTCFFWLNVLCFHIWKEVIQPSCLENVKIWTVFYHIYGFGAPLLAAFWLLIVQHGNSSALAGIHPGIGLGRCWFKSLRESNIYFTGPVGVLLAINIIYFVWTIVGIWNRSKNCPKTKVAKYRLRMYVKIFFVMGITWIYEIISSVFQDDAPKWVWIITDIINASQGIIIFLVLVVFRKSVKRALANRKFFNWRLPAQWKNDRDSECEELDEDMSLSCDVKRRIDL